MFVNIGQFARIPANLILEDMRPRARQLLVHMAMLCSPEKPTVWVNQRQMANEMHVHKETVGRWVRYLEKIGRIMATGRLIYGRYKEYKLIYVRDQLPHALNTHNKTAVPPTAIPLTHQKQFRMPINKNKNNEYQQHTITLSETGNALHAFQIPKAVIAELLQTYGEEQAKRQLEHLTVLEKQGKKVRNKAAWLIAAIKGNYSLPNDALNDDEEKAKAKRHEIARLELELPQLLSQGHFEEAHTLALKILSIGESSEAQKVIDHLKQQREKTKLLESARARVSAQEQEILWQKAKDQVINLASVLGKSASEVFQHKMFQIMAEKNFETLLIAHCGPLC